MLPLEDVVVSIDDVFVRDLIAAQLPFEMDVDRFHLSLKEAEVHFRGSPAVRLRGSFHLKAHPGLEASVEVFGSLEGIQVDRSSSILAARIAVDHIGIERAAGIEPILGGRPRRGSAHDPAADQRPAARDPDPGQGAASSIA